MKSQLKVPEVASRLSVCLVAILGFHLAAPTPASAQEQNVTISAAEFQRVVYAADLLTRLPEKPELDAALTVMLDLHRRNPQSDASALADLSRQALQRYRANAAHTYGAKGHAYRDEVLANYLDALRQVPARTNFVPATLHLLNGLMSSPDQLTNRSPAELIHSGSQRFRSSADTLAQRRRLLNSCTARMGDNSAFAVAVEGLLFPETFISIHTPAGSIVGHTNSALRDSATLQALLSISQNSSDGSVTVSSNQLLTLFNSEAAGLWNVIHTNLALRQEFNQSQPDYAAYLSNPSALAMWQDRQNLIQQSSVRQIASATAAILTQSRLIQAASPLVELPSGVTELGDGLCAFADLVGGVFSEDPAQAISGAWNLFNLMTFQESAEDQIIREVGNLQILLGDLSTNLNYRFDRVDQSLTVIFQTLNEEFSKIHVALDEQGRRIFTVQGGVNEVRRRLLTTEAGLHRLERELFTGFNEVQRNDLVLAINGALFYEAFNPTSMAYGEYSGIPNGPENTFYSYASDLAQNALSSPANFSASDLSASALQQQLAARPLDANLNYVKQFLLTTLGQNTDGVLPLTNPRDWFAASDAYLQLVVENPMHFRTKGLRVPTLISRGENLIRFFRSLTIDGGNVNWRLQDAVKDYYGIKLGVLTNAVRGIEQTYAVQHGLALDTWRDWLASAPRVVVRGTKVMASPRAAFSEPPLMLSASETHFLVLRRDLTAVDFGVVPDYGQPAVPAGLTNFLSVAAGVDYSLGLLADGRVVTWHTMGPFGIQTNNIHAVAISAGLVHSLALLTDGRVTAWGNNNYGQLNIPNNLSNVVAIAAGERHSLALTSDGRVVAWGNNDSGQATSPATATNLVALAAGGKHNLALRADGAVIGWGANPYGEATPPAQLSNVVAIAAGAHHSLALRADGTVTAWGAGTGASQGPDSGYGQSSVPSGLTHVVAIAAGGNYSLALQADGSLVAWGYTFQGHSAPPDLPGDVVSLSAGVAHNVALLANGTVVTWGDQAAPPASASNVVAVAAGYNHSLALRADGTVVGWGYNFRGEADGAAAGGNIVAIAAGFLHSLGLRSDGKVVGWGDRGGGQGSLPAGATNIVAIAVGAEHNLALRADGQVFGWGLYSSYAVPPQATNVVAIAAGGSHFLALRADRTLIAWGNNDYGQAQIPAAASNVVAIAADAHHSLALRADGRAVAWGEGYYGQTLVPSGATGIIALAAGAKHSLFLTASGGSGAAATSGGWVVDRAQVPAHVRRQLREVYSLLLTNLDLDLHDAAAELTGAKALWTVVSELGLPDTIEGDTVLRGFLYGDEALPDLEICRAFLQAEQLRIEGTPESGPRGLNATAVLRQRAFAIRLKEQLNELVASGRPELPRLVQHTLRLLNLAREAWDAVAPPVLEAGYQASIPSLVLYAEPYTHYHLQSRSEVNGGVWVATPIVNLRDDQLTPLPISGPRGFYRALLP